MLAATLLPGLLTTGGGRSQTQGGVRKNPLVALKSQETGFGGCMPRSRPMSKVLRFILRFAHAEEENIAI